MKTIFQLHERLRDFMKCLVVFCSESHVINYTNIELFLEFFKMIIHL